MSADFTQDAVLDFLQSRGGSVRNADLLLYFRPFLRDHADRDRYRELFKKFVNSVASVRQEDGVSYVVLKRKFRGHVPGAGDGSGGGALGLSSGNVFPCPTWNADKPRYKSAEVVPAQPRHIATKSILPAAGIILHNNSSSVETNLYQMLHKPQPSTASVPTSSALQEVFTAPPAQPLHGKAEAPVRNPRQTKSAQKQELSPKPVHVTREESRLKEHGEPKVPFQPAESAPSPAPVFTALPPLQLGSFSKTSVTPSQIYLGFCEAPIMSQIEKRCKHQETSAKSVQLDLSEVPFQENASKISFQTQPEKPADSVPAHSEPKIRFETHTEQKLYPQAIAPRHFRHRQSYRSAVSFDDDDDEEEDIEEVVSDRRGSVPRDAPDDWDLKVTIGNSNRIMSQSSLSLKRTVPQIQVQDLEPISGQSSEGPPTRREKLSPSRTLPQIEIQDLEPDSGRGSEAGHVTQVGPQKAHGHRSSPTLDQHQISWLSSSVSNISPASGFSSSDRASILSSSEDLQSTASVRSSPASGPSVFGTGVEDGLQRAQRATPQLGPNGSDSKINWHQSAEDLHLQQEPAPVLRAWHHSSGDLYDDGAESSNGTASSLAIYLRPVVARRLSSKLRSRMCASVGADLDQLLQDEDRRALGGSEAARLNRLHLISSSLSLRHLSSSSLSSCSTPPRCHSLADLMEKDAKKGRRSLPSTTHPQEGSSRQSQVPLEVREHLWLVKAAAGAWPDIYSLFREDSSLLHRRDFISGFTVLHWIAKHGDHRVLNTLWYGVEKASLTFDIDAQSSCGYTPLHIAAIHNHRNIIRVLVNKFSANNRLRDSAGKRAWFYLHHSSPPDVFQLLGAPPKAALGQTGASQHWGSPPQQQKPQKRRQRHHFSSASGEQPLALAGNTKVKRSTSLVAFLKHKSLQKAKAQSEWVV